MNDLDFRHRLFDTLVLLGCRLDIANLIKKSEDLSITDEELEELRRYNASLIDGLKTRLVSINTITIQVANE